MKYKNLIFIAIVAFTTLVGSWVIPSLAQKMTDESKGYPLMYYSARLKELCLIDFRTHPDFFSDIKGNRYARADYDSLLPLLNARQLMLDGTMPDSIDGHAIDMKTLRMTQVMFRYRPQDMQMPQPPMGVLFEAMPKRGKLTLPGDYFTLTDRITFTDAETNTTDEKKSKRFQEEMQKKGFAFPAQGYWGNPSTRKPYEEGYFCLDAHGELFHLKMVNGRPFVKNTHLSDSLDIRWFVMSEVSDKRFYGFVFGREGEVGIIESTAEGGYFFRRLDIRPFCPEKDQLTILGNLLYWTVSVTDSHGMDTYGLDTETLSCLSSYYQPVKQVMWDSVSEWLFPFRLSLQSEENAFINLYWHTGTWKAFLLNALLALSALLLFRRTSPARRGLCAGWVLLTGIPGWVALLIMKKEN